MKKVLVTGGGGFLGKAMVKKLLDRGCAVTSFSRQFYPELERMGAAQVSGDLADRAAVNAAVRDMDTVFQCGG